MFCFGNFCLICINNVENLINLDVNIVLSDEKVSLLQILMEIDSELLNFNEIFPKFICETCKKDLLTTYQFHKKCRKSIDNINNYILKLNNPQFPSRKKNIETKKTYTFGYNAITSRHMLFKIKQLTKQNYKTRKSKIKSISARSNFTSIDSNYSESISDKSTIILEKTHHFNLKSTIDKLAKCLNITDLEKLDQNILDHNILDHDDLDLTDDDTLPDVDTSAIINQKFDQIIETAAQDLNRNDLINLDQEFNDTFNVSDDQFVKEENALDLGSCDLSDICSSSKNFEHENDVKNVIKDEIKTECTDLDVSSKLDNSTYTSNNNYIDLTTSPKKSNILRDLSNSPIRSKNIRTQCIIDLTGTSPSKGSNKLDQESDDVGEIIDHVEYRETNLDLKLTGSNNSVVLNSEEKPNNLALNNCYENLLNSIELDIKQELIEGETSITSGNLSQSPVKSTKLILEPSNLELNTSVTDRPNDDLNNSFESEIKSSNDIENFAAQDYVFPEFYLEDLNSQTRSKNSEIEIEEHPIKMDPDEMCDVKLEIEEILKEHANLESETFKNNISKRKLDLSESNKDSELSNNVQKRLKIFGAARKVPDLASFSSKIIENTQLVLSKDVNDPKVIREPNDPNVKVEKFSSLCSNINENARPVCPKDVNDPINVRKTNDPHVKNSPKSIKKVPDLVSFSSKIIQNVQLVNFKDVNDPKKLEEPKTTSPKSTKCNTATLLSINLNDPNLEPDNSPNDPNLEPKLPKSSPKFTYIRNLIHIDLKDTVYTPQYFQVPNDPKVPNINVPKVNDPIIKIRNSQEPNKKVLIKIQSFKKPFIVNHKDPDIQELEMFDFNDPKECHKKEIPDKLDLVKDTVPNDPKETIDFKEPNVQSSNEKEAKDSKQTGLDNKDPKDPKTQDLDPNENLRPDTSDNKCLSTKEIDLQETCEKDPNDPIQQTEKFNSYILLSPLKINLKESSNDLNDPKFKNSKPSDPQIENNSNEIKYLSPEIIDLAETSPNDPKNVNLLPNDPRNKNSDIIAPETKHCNQTRRFCRKMLNFEEPNDPKTYLEPIDPKSPDMLAFDFFSDDELSPEKNASFECSPKVNDPNDPKLGPTDPDSISEDVSSNIKKNSTIQTENKTPEAYDSNDPSKDPNPSTPKGPNASTSKENATFTPHTCRFCPKAYETGLELKNHIFDEHKNKFNECSTCKATFSTRYKLLRHIDMYHSDSPNTVRSTNPDLRDVNFRNYDYPNFKCFDNRPPRSYELGAARGSFRKEYFRSGTGFRNDDFRARNFGPLYCEICSKLFRSTYNLNKHYYLEHYC